MTRRRPHSALVGCTYGIVVSLAACDDGTGPEDVSLVVLSGDGQSAVVGEGLPQPLRVSVTARSGDPVQGVELSWSVTAGSGTLANSVTSADDTGRSENRLVLGVTPGVVQVLVELSSGQRVTFLATADPRPGPSITIIAPPAQVRQGDVWHLQAEATDSLEQAVDPSAITWTLFPDMTGFIAQDGRFVGFTPGISNVIASVEGAADTAAIDVSPRGLSGSFSVVGVGQVADRFTSDLWVHGGNAYTGTLRCRSLCGNVMYVWDIGDPSQPSLVDSVFVDAETVNDVKVRSDGNLAVITHEGSADGLNGITLLDLSDPAHPTVITRFTEQLEEGVHNVWIDGDYVYAASDGRPLRIIDISQPDAPQIAASFYAGSSLVHDVYVRDGLAFVSHWGVGLVILDVGNGVLGGSPTNPVEVSRIDLSGETHNAWYWPEAKYVFVGEEDFAKPGIVHVVDVTEMASPVEVATYAVDGIDPAHNFWVDEAAGILYVGYYSNGVRAVDVSGALFGELERGGREIAASLYAGDLTNTWGPQLHNGFILTSDILDGLVVLELR